MEAIENYFTEEEVAEIKSLTKKVNAFNEKLAAQDLSEELYVATMQEAKILKEKLEEIRLACFHREYRKLSDEDQYHWWVREFENQIKARTGGEYIYCMFTKEQYDYWTQLDEDFDDLLLQLCMDFDLEYELAFMLCEHPQYSEMWKHLIELNEE